VKVVCVSGGKLSLGNRRSLYNSISWCKIWGFHDGDYEECRLLGYKHTICTSQATHYFCAREPSRLMIRKIWGFHSGDYKEWHLLGHKHPVRTTQETYYVSVTEPSRLMLCKIWGFYGGDYEEWRLLWCDAVGFYKTHVTPHPRRRHSSTYH
jgi:hypothetical protein